VIGDGIVKIFKWWEVKRIKTQVKITLKREPLPCSTRIKIIKRRVLHVSLPHSAHPKTVENHCYTNKSQCRIHKFQYWPQTSPCNSCHCCITGELLQKPCRTFKEVNITLNFTIKLQWLKKIRIECYYNQSKWKTK